MHRFLSWLSRKLFPPVESYVIEEQALLAMRAFSQQTHPKEAFGVLIGRRAGNVLRIERVVYQPFSNTQTSATVIIDRYSIDDMAGTFHSHPVPDSRPSAADKRLYARYPGLHCIMPYPYQSVSVYNQRGQRIGENYITRRAAEAQAR